MALNRTELGEVAQELSAHLPGFAVQKLWVPIPKLAYLELRQPGGTKLLLCLRAGKTGRVSLARDRLSSPAPLGLQAALRHHLLAARIAALDSLPGNTGVRLSFRRGQEERALVLELAGAGNLVLLGPGDRVLALAERDPDRPLRPGQPYAPPASAQTELEPSRLVPVGGSPLPYAEAAEALFAGAERVSHTQQARRAVLAPLKAKLKRLARTREKVQAEAERGPIAAEHRRVGELLAQNTHAIPRGASAARVVEYGPEGPVEVVVALHPGRTPAQEVEWRFHQYRRLSRGAELARGRLLELEREAQEVREQLERAERAEGVQGPEAEAFGAGAPRGKPARRRERAEAKPFREHVVANGGRIWVGKGGRDNDALTFKLARPHDMWLHARGVPGAHVVVPLEKGAELAPEVLLDAAHLALHHSALKGEPSGEVSYTRVKFVRRVKDAAPGQVTYTQEKTFRVRVEPSRLERLLRQGS